MRNICSPLNLRHNPLSHLKLAGKVPIKCKLDLDVDVTTVAF